MKRIRLTLLTMLLAPAIAQAAVYKWTDGQGIVHYDDINLAAGKLMTQDDVKNRAIKPVPDWVGVVPADFAGDVERRCAQTRERLNGYRSAKTLYGRDPDGNTYRLSATQARLLVAQTERETANLCDENAARRLYLQPRQKAATSTN